MAISNRVPWKCYFHHEAHEELEGIKGSIMISTSCPSWLVEKTEQQYVPNPLQRSRAGAVFSEDAGRLFEQTRLTASVQNDRRVSARAEKTV
ncbi:MAG: hypothetical protein SWH68_04505, partial [Thermodesulfobacteriota bacterium]|nr:hypothetical protein [Thermodesulfobacteriota bacterium]